MRLKIKCILKGKKIKLLSIFKKIITRKWTFEMQTVKDNFASHKTELEAEKFFLCRNKKNRCNFSLHYLKTLDLVGYTASRVE